MRQSTDKLPNNFSLAPISVFAIVLVITFAAECAIMLVLPLLPTWSKTPLSLSVIDASLLSILMAPVIWWTAVKPLRLLSESRGNLLHSLFLSQEQERSRIARDLHDEIGQQLTAIMVGLGAMESTNDLQSAQKLAHDLRSIGADAHEEVRRIVRDLGPGVLKELGLEAAVARLCEDFMVLHGIPVKLVACETAMGDLPVAVETNLYRILQECLTNVARHAKAKSVDVTFSRNDDMITLTVGDDGCGMSEARFGPQKTGMGLNSICERAGMLDGECAIYNEDGKGVTVQVKIPV